MKKLTLISSVLALVLALSLAACGGNSNTGGSSTTPPASSATTPPPADNTPSGGNETTAPSNNENTADDWQAWLKEAKGIDLVLPDGYTVRTADVRSSYELVFDLTVGGSITSIDFGQQLMDLTAAAASNGNHQVHLTDEGRVVEGDAMTDFLDSVTSFLEDKSEGFVEWCYTYNGDLQTVTYQYNAKSIGIAFH
ncbi:MAG: hypothetical protein LBN99_06070 [Oscillospiraceae bacterium]|jgi:hypothetical protein|nr:hypothetical protein [Oscillospiraceae bacterium]